MSNQHTIHHIQPINLPPPQEMTGYLCVYIYHHPGEKRPYHVYNTEHDQTNDCSINILHTDTTLNGVKAYIAAHGGFLFKSEVDSNGRVRDVAYILRYVDKPIPPSLGMWAVNQADSGYF